MKGNSLGEKLHEARRNLKREFLTYRLLSRDPRTPRPAKLLLGLALGYALLPFDLIPDFIPVIGHLDDAIIVPGLILLALRCVSPDVISDCRAQAEMETQRNEKSD